MCQDKIRNNLVDINLQFSKFPLNVLEGVGWTSESRNVSQTLAELNKFGSEGDQLTTYSASHRQCNSRNLTWKLKFKDIQELAICKFSVSCWLLITDVYLQIFKCMLATAIRLTTTKASVKARIRRNVMCYITWNFLSHLKISIGYVSNFYNWCALSLRTIQWKTKCLY